MVTAGPTREPLDPVRFISNRSSGKMGYAIAAAARLRGHDVLLVSGPVALEVPAGIRRIMVETAEQMQQAVIGNLDTVDALVMAAAVADWRPAVVHRQKQKKSKMEAVLQLEPVPDILAQVAGIKGSRLVVGFAAETENLLGEARRKLSAKRLDMIVANDVTAPDAGFEVDTNRVVLVWPDGSSRELPCMPKSEVAQYIIEWLEKQLPASTA